MHTSAPSCSAGQTFIQVSASRACILATGFRSTTTSVLECAGLTCAEYSPLTISMAVYSTSSVDKIKPKRRPSGTRPPHAFFYPQMYYKSVPQDYPPSQLRTLSIYCPTDGRSSSCRSLRWKRPPLGLRGQIKTYTNARSGGVEVLVRRCGLETLWAGNIIRKS